ncbi:MAG: cytochrome c oxidase subunit II [Nitrososphaerota archaeon]|nr:cytochrome c oxidase subunit II [Nitrososphaerota archaeon]
MEPVYLLVEPQVATGDLFRLFAELGTIVGAVVIGYMVYNMFRYRAKGDDGNTLEDYYKGEHKSHGGWRYAVISGAFTSVILITLFALTMNAAAVVLHPPASNDTIYVDVTGHQFYWNFTYPDGHSQIDNLTLPAGAVVVLNVTSTDVFHSFGIAGLDLKIDAIPGRVNTVWLTVPTPGEYTIRCYELCGSGHALMTGKLYVVSPSTYNQWYSSLPG